MIDEDALKADYGEIKIILSPSRELQ